MTIKPSHGVDALYALRRTVLDPILVDAAIAAGAQVRFGSTVSDVTRDSDGRADGVIVRDRAAGPCVRGHPGRRRRRAVLRDRPRRRSAHRARGDRCHRSCTGTGPASTSTATTGCSVATPPQA